MYILLLRPSPHALCSVILLIHMYILVTTAVFSYILVGGLVCSCPVFDIRWYLSIGCIAEKCTLLLLLSMQDDVGSVNADGLQLVRLTLCLVQERHVGQAYNCWTRPFNRYHFSCDDCLEDKREDYQNCSVTAWLSCDTLVLINVIAHLLYAGPG